MKERKPGAKRSFDKEDSNTPESSDKPPAKRSRMDAGMIVTDWEMVEEADLDPYSGIEIKEYEMLECDKRKIRYKSTLFNNPKETIDKVKARMKVENEEEVEPVKPYFDPMTCVEDHD